jgi:hexosaminidase
MPAKFLTFNFTSILTMSIFTLLIFTALITTSGCDSFRDASPTTQSSTTQSPANSAQQTLDNLAKTLTITYTIVTNQRDANCLADRADGHCFQAKITLKAPQPSDFTDWEIYFSHTAPIQSFESQQFTVKHINGDLHRITPSSSFNGFKAGSSVNIIIRADHWHVSEADPMPNYYLTGDQLQPRVIESTRTTTDPATGLELRPYVTEFSDPEKQFKRTATEKTQWATAEYLFNTNKAHTDGQSTPDRRRIAQTIIPTPSNVLIDPNNAMLNLSNGINVKTVNFARTAITAALGRLASFNVMESASGVPLDVQLRAEQKSPSGAYTLDISTDRISIAAVDEAGAANAIQSLASLLTLDKLSIPAMKITDQPRFAFRGVLLDVARNFHSKQQLLKLLDQMAAYKLNKLHLHLADDEGWRLQIPGLPELTDIAGKRCHDLSETRCLLPQLGSGPFERTAVNGFYSTQDYQEIVKFAAERHIQVIPSFDMPGHSRAAIKSMAARHKRLIAQDKPAQALQYLLHDPKDSTEYQSIQFYNDNTLNVCIESTYTFIAKVIGEIKKLHDDAGQPLQRYHIGADETAGAWSDSPQCQQFLADNDSGITKTEQLGAYFIERVSAILHKRSIEPAGWSDGLSRTHTNNMPPVVQANSWGTLFWNGHKEAHELAARGWEVVLSTPDATYFDFPYEADPKERGYYWGARSINTKKVFEFMPDNLAAHAEVWTDREGNNMKLTADADHKHHRFAGIQAQLWSETTRTDNQVDYLYFPRLIALAERAWHQADWELPYPDTTTTYHPSSGFFTPSHHKRRELDWRRFVSALGFKELAKLDKSHVRYRIPTVGATISQGTLQANMLIPGLTIEFQENGGQWQHYKHPTAVTGPVMIRARSADGSRAGRSLSVNPKNYLGPNQ